MKKVLVIRFNLFWHFLAFWAGPRNLRKDCGPGRKNLQTPLSRAGKLSKIWTPTSTEPSEKVALRYPSKVRVTVVRLV